MAKSTAALRASAERYRENLFESVLPFWMRHSVDREFGGYFTCLDREGKVYDTRKYVWLNGRQVWTLARMFNEVEPREEWLEAARLGVEFLRRHVFDERERCYFSLTREGSPVFFQRKPYGAVFVMLGLLEYARATSNDTIRREAIALFDRIQHWLERPELLGRPALAGAPAMTQLADVYVNASMGLELYHATGEVRYLDILKKCLRDVEAHYDAGTGLLTENAGPGLRQFPEGRLACAGSIFEIAWFLFRVLELHPDPALESKLLRSVEAAWEFSWDRERGGGFHYFQDIEGRPLLPLEGSMKLWWVHAEALYCLIHAYAITGDEKWLRIHSEVEAYVFSHFADPEHGEWFGYLERDGSPAQTLKGNNYKGCFHIPRALLFSLQKIQTLSG